MSRKIPLLRLAWRNTHRNARRTLLTVSAVIVAVSTIIFVMAYIEGIFTNALDTYSRMESGHVRIRKAGYSERERSMPLHLNVAGLDEILPELRSMPGVTEALPRIRMIALVDGASSNRPGLLYGLELEREQDYLNPGAMLVEGRLPREGRPEVMVGRDFAADLEVAPGDSLTLLGQTAYRFLGGLRVAVTGLGESGVGHLDQKLIVAPLDQVQLMTDMQDAATEILIFTPDPAAADTLATAVAHRIEPMVADGVEVLSWSDQGPLVNLLNSYGPIMGVLLFFFLLMAGLVIVNTMLMTVLERTKEFGMLSAMGMRPGNIAAMIVAEGLVIGLIGAVVGGAIGTGVSVWLENAGMDFSQAMRNVELPINGIIYPDWQLQYTVIGLLLGLAAAGIATLYPAFRATRQTAADALRG